MCQSRIQKFTTRFCAAAKIHFLCNSKKDVVDGKTGEKGIWAVRFKNTTRSGNMRREKYEERKNRKCIKSGRVDEKAREREREL